jgi:hypothetical protein
VLNALARVLRLGPAERAHRFHLARVELPLPGGDYPRVAPPELAALVDGLVPNPAYLLGPRTDVLAWNRAAAQVIGEPQAAPDGRPNLLWWVLAEQLGTKTVAHPRLGTLRLHHMQSVPTSHPDLRLTQFAPADEATRAVLATLSAATPRPPRAPA